MELDRNVYARLLEKVAEDFDIPPSKYQDVVDRYQSVGQWLEGGKYPGCSGELSIYPQGSFRLGTVVRPIRDGIEASYDIDLACELPIKKHQTDPNLVKRMIGNRLREHATYQRMLDEEGKRCWTLEYAEQDGVGFHLDVLPAVPNPSTPLDTSIAITNKRGALYDWSSSNPRGYGTWFDTRNHRAFELVSLEQKKSIQARTSHLYARADDVPDQLIRTPLQRVIQLMKRHRDMKFNDVRYKEFSPISIIITTLAAQCYQNELDVYSALTGIVSKLSAHAVLVDNGMVDQSITSVIPIKRTPEGKWYLGNPVNPEENFADRWHEDNHARAKAFFSWVGALREDLVNILAGTLMDNLSKRLTHALGEKAVSRNLHLITPTTAAAVVSPPRIQISKAAKPWRL